MNPDFLEKWEHILDDVETHKVPVTFIKKMVIRLEGKKQHTINVEKFLSQGLDPEQIEDIINRKMQELEDSAVSMELILNVQIIADTVQTETDKILGRL